MPVVVCRTLEDLQRHRPGWESLAGHASEPNPFFEPWFVIPAMKLCPPTSARFLFLLDSAGAYLGFVPLVRHKPTMRRPLSILEIWTHPYQFLATPLLRAGQEIQALDALLGWLRRDRDSAALWRLEGVSKDGPFALALEAALTRHSRPSYQIGVSTRALLERRPGNGSDYLEQALHGRRRKELRRKERNLAAKGVLEHRTLSSGEDPTPWIEDFLAVEASGWKGREGTAFASDPAHADFLREMAGNAHANGRLDLLGLYLDGRPIAMKMNLRAGSGSFAFKIGYDESQAAHSPGVLLEAYNIERFHEQDEAKWMDSCAQPDSELFARLWTEQKGLQDLWIATGRAPGDLAVSLMPLARWAKRCWRWQRAECPA